jgi:hypothetical protein
MNYQIAELNPSDVAKMLKDTKVVGRDRRPKIVYHGTCHTFKRFSAHKRGGGIYGKGFYFAEEPELAEVYSTDAAEPSTREEYEEYLSRGNCQPNIWPVYLNIKNPLYMRKKEYSFKDFLAFQSVAKFRISDLKDTFEPGERVDYYDAYNFLADGDEEFNRHLAKLGYDGIAAIETHDFKWWKTWVTFSVNQIFPIYA